MCGLYISIYVNMVNLQKNQWNQRNNAMSGGFPCYEQAYLLLDILHKAFIDHTPHFLIEDFQPNGIHDYTENGVQKLSTEIHCIPSSIPK